MPPELFSSLPRSHELFFFKILSSSQLLYSKQFISTQLFPTLHHSCPVRSSQLIPSYLISVYSALLNVVSSFHIFPTLLSLSLSSSQLMSCLLISSHLFSPLLTSSQLISALVSSSHLISALPRSFSDHLSLSLV